MTVQTRPDTDTTTEPLAGSAESTEHPASDDTTDDTARSARRPAKPPAPRTLAHFYERCDHPIRGSCGGFAAVDLRATGIAIANPDVPKARWRLVHKRCLPQAVAPLSPYFVLWCKEIARQMPCSMPWPN